MPRGDLQRREERRALDEIVVAWCSAEGTEEVDQGGLFGLTDAFKVEDFTEVGVGPVGDVDEIRLDKSFWRRRADLEGFEQRVHLGHALVDSFNEAVADVLAFIFMFVDVGLPYLAGGCVPGSSLRTGISVNPFFSTYESSNICSAPTSEIGLLCTMLAI